MSFRPNAHDTLTIDGIPYEIAEHPAAPGLPHGQEGRAGTVYKLLPSPHGEGAGLALKVFKPRFRLPYLVSQAQKIAPFADLPGLAACRRTVLTPFRHADLLNAYPDLTYAVLMPWIEGPTWLEVLVEKQPLPQEQSLALARALATVLARMEEQGLAHCDLSAPNLILPGLTDRGAQTALPTVDRRPWTVTPAAQPPSSVNRPPSTVQLIDLEGLYAPGLTQPNALSSGSMGYAHHEAAGGLWQPEADRFAGAVLLAEMLAWCDPQAVEAAWGESYFDPAEMQQDTPRYRTMLESLRRNWGEGVAGLFQRAWTSDSLADCPTFGEWMVALPLAVSRESSAVNRPPSTVHGPSSTESTVYGPSSTVLPEIRALMRVAQRLEEMQNIPGALEAYREALRLAQESQNAALAKELGIILNELEKRRTTSAAPATPFPPRQAEPPEDDLDLLFDQAQQALHGQEWAKAYTLLNTIYQRQPDYQRHGQKAWLLLQEADRQMRKALEGWGELQRFTLKKGWGSAPTVWAITFATRDTLYAGCDDGTIWHIDIESGTAEPWTSKVPAMILGLSYHADGILATASRDSLVRLWRIPDGILLRTLEGHKRDITSVAFSPDGRLLASGSWDSTVRLWRVADSSLLKTIEGHKHRVSSIALSPDGNLLASGSWDNTVRLWRVADGALLRTLKGHTGWVLSVAFSPDGALLASGSYDNTVRLWRVADGALLRTLKGHTGWVLSVAFSPDGALLASGSWDGTVRLWGVR
jgi:tetratricopeptide (TPR) repeat protein